jgi:hypothetical protein
MKRFSVICLQCGLNVSRLIDVEMTQTEIHPVTYRQKCKIAPDAVDFNCPELERAVEMSRCWDPIFQGGMSRPASREDAVVFPEPLSEASANNQKPVAEKADLSVEATDLSRPAFSDDAVVFPEPLSEESVNNQKLVAEKADLRVEADDLSRPAISDDAVVVPEPLSEESVNNQKLVAEKADLSVEALDLSHPTSSDDVVVFPDALSEASGNSQKLVAEKADLSVEVADLSAGVGVTDMVNAAPTTPGDLKLDELRSALSKALERFSARGDARI